MTTIIVSIIVMSITIMMAFRIVFLIVFAVAIFLILNAYAPAADPSRKRIECT